MKSRPHSRKALWLPLCAAMVVIAFPPQAHADTKLSVLGKGLVSELSHLREIQLSAGAIEVTETISFANAGKASAEVLYRFDLPAQAAIHGLEIETANGLKSKFGVVDAKAATRLVVSPDEDASPDLGLLRMVGVQDDESDRRRRYELRVFPVPGQLSAKVVIRWRSPVAIVAGRYSIRIPGRGQAANLARSQVLLRTSMATQELYGGGAELSAGKGKDSRKGKRKRFFEPAEGDLVIQAKPKISKLQPYAEVALFPLSKTTGVAAVRVVLPAAANKVAPRFSRVLVIVDVSRSMGEQGREAASKLVDALLADMGTGTQVEAILYDRSPSQVLGSWRAGSKEARSKILRAIRAAPNNNGSDLRRALDLARNLLKGDKDETRKNDTLIAVISDGILPSNLSGADAAFSLGPDVMEDSRVLSAVLVPPNAPLPDLSENAMSALAYQGRGRVASLHYGDAAKMGKILLKGLTQPQPLHTLTLELDRGKFVGAHLKGAVPPGSSVLALGFYEGGVPKGVSVQAKQGGKIVRLSARKLPASAAKAWAYMALASATPDSFPGGLDPKSSRRAFVKAAAALGVVTQVSAGVAIDKADAFANDRLALAKKQGGQHYRRLPPPAEIGPKTHSFDRFEILPRGRGRGFGSEETGRLDRKIITRRMRTHAIPMARGCYDKLLRRDHKAGGKVHVRFELSRGEVHHVELPELSLSLEPIRGCITNAVYAMPIPTVRQGSDPEQINLVNYPLRFRLQKPGKGKVIEGTPDQPASTFDTADPLSGMPK